MEKIFIERECCVAYAIMAINAICHSANKERTINEFTEEIKTMFKVYEDQKFLLESAEKVINEHQNIKISVNDKKYITLKECANYLGISKQLMNELVLEKDFPCIRFKRRILIDKKKIQEWFDNNHGKKIKY